MDYFYWPRLDQFNWPLTADNLSEQAIELYDNFHYLYKVFIHELNLFNSKGELRQRVQVEGNMEAALELMASLNHKAINKTLTSVKKALPDLLTYFDEAPVVVKRCQKFSTNKEALHALYLAWQWNPLCQHTYRLQNFILGDKNASRSENHSLQWL